MLTLLAHPPSGFVPVLPPPLSPRAEAFADLVPVSAAHTLALVVRSHYDEFVEPAFGCSSETALEALIRRKLPAFLESSKALLGLLSRLSSMERASLAGRDALRRPSDMLLRAIEAGGEVASAEFRFCLDTAERALAQVDRILPLPSPDFRRRDAELVVNFDFGLGLFNYGLTLLLDLPLRDAFPPWLVPFSMEMMRDGSLAAYAAASEALELRLTVEPVPSVPAEVPEPVGF